MNIYIYILLLLGSSGNHAEKIFPRDWPESFNSNDVDAHVESPCPHNNMNCIRRYFAQHSHCKESHGPIPEPFFIKQVILPQANANITFILNNFEVTGMNGHITVFTINRKTNNLVLEIAVKNLTMTVPDTELRYHRKGKEPIVLTDESMVTFASLTFTAIIPNINQLDISKIEVFSYIEDSNPLYSMGPGTIARLDDEVIRSFNKLVRNIPDNIKETFVFLGPVLALNFIQYNICDFGLKIY